MFWMCSYGSQVTPCLPIFAPFKAISGFNSAGEPRTEIDSFRKSIYIVKLFGTFSGVQHCRTQGFHFFFHKVLMLYVFSIQMKQDEVS